MNKFLLLVCLFTAVSGYGLEFEQKIVIEGFLRRAERLCMTTDSDGKEKTRVENSIVLVTDQPLVLSRSVTMGEQQIATMNNTYSHVEVYLAEEFIPLINKRVQCSGYFKKSLDRFEDTIVLDVDTALDSEHIIDKLKTFFYEPEEVELSGKLYRTIYPGPPEYMSVEMGDCSEEVVILTLKDPIDVEITEEDDINEPEIGVRELQAVFVDSMPSVNQMKEEISLKGTLYHAHTAHHHRRVLMWVKSWNVNNEVSNSAK